MGDLCDLLASSRDLLSTRQRVEVGDLQERCDMIERPTVDLSVISDLTTLCLLYEDALHCREEATSKLWLTPVVRDLRARVARHGAAADFYAEKADELLTVEDGMAYARRFGECLADLEGALRAPEGGAA